MDMMPGGGGCFQDCDFLGLQLCPLCSLLTLLLPLRMGVCILLPHGLLSELWPLLVPYSTFTAVGLLAF